MIQKNFKELKISEKISKNFKRTQKKLKNSIKLNTLQRIKVIKLH